MKNLIFFIILIVICVGGYWYFTHQKEISTSNPTIEGTPPGKPTFTWNYSAPIERDYIPYSTISLTATYENGTAITKTIEEIEGGCNTYTQPDKDVYEKSEMIICYYAGLGRYYKVVEQNGSYIVLRKEFEEGTPDYNPPSEEFKPIAIF